MPCGTPTAGQLFIQSAHLLALQHSSSAFVAFVKESRLKAMDKFPGDYEDLYDLLVFSETVAEDHGCFLAPLLTATLWFLF